MTTIPSLNIVIQLGDAVRESQNIRNQALESAQQATAQRLEEEDRKRTAVRETEETDKILFNKESSGEGKRQPAHRGPRKKKKREPDTTTDPDATGRLLNTIV